MPKYLVTGRVTGQGSIVVEAADEDAAFEKAGGAQVWRVELEVDDFEPEEVQAHDDV